MRINSISAYQSRPIISTKRAQNVSSVQNNIQSTGIPMLHISFKGNPNKHPEQISAFATESNYLGGIYKAGGLGDVAEALPESIGIHSQEIIGKKIDMRTFLPYYSMDDAEGRVYVLKSDSAEKAKKGEQLTRANDFLQVGQDYKLKEGEQFALITDLADSQKVKQYHLLKDTGVMGTVDRMSKKGFEMEKVPYRIFEVDTMGKRQDRMYLIHTPEHAKGKSSYGVYRTHAATMPTGTSAYGGGGGTTAYGGGTTAYGGGTTAYGGGTTAYGGGTSAYGGAEGAERRMHYTFAKTDDMFYTEQMRAYQKATIEGGMNTASQGYFNPQNHMFHDRFCYSALTDMTQKAKLGDKNYEGLKSVEILHNPGAAYQGKYANPIDFFRIVATPEDLSKLQANEHYGKVVTIAEKIEKGVATEEESTKVYKFFKPYFKKFMDSEGLFNMTMLAVRMTDENPQNSNLGNVSRNYGKETRNLDTIDIAKGLTEELIAIQDKTIDVVNGAKPANMATEKMGAFFGTGTLNEVMKTQYSPFKATDTPDVIFNAKKANKRVAIDTIAEATSKLGEDADAVAKVFFGESKLRAIREQAASIEPNLPLTLGGLSKYSEGDILFTSWGRPDAQKGLPIILESFENLLRDESIPIETRKHCKLIMGAGGGNDAFSGNNPEWTAIKDSIKRIGEIELDGQKGIFKGNACYVNGLFPNRIANCVDAGVFTSRFEPCGITPFESFATGTPVFSTNTGGAPDFITPGKTGFLTKDPFMLNPEKVGLEATASADALDKARRSNIAKQMAEQMKSYLEPIKDGSWETKQKEYIKNCLAEKIEWHNNNAYNGGKSALEMYLDKKFNTRNNDIPSQYASDMRGEFDNSAFAEPKVETPKVETVKPKLETDSTEVVESGFKKFFKSKGGKIAAIAAGILAVVGLIYAAYKKGSASNKQAIVQQPVQQPVANQYNSINRINAFNGFTQSLSYKA